MKDRSGLQKLAIVGVCLYALAFIWFYPPIYSTLDEDDYLTMSYVLRTGTIYYDQAGYAPTFATTISPTGHVVAKHPPGTSFLLIPFTVFGAAGTFLSGLVFQLIGWFLFTRTLIRAGVSSEEEAALFGLLYLCFPLHVIQSRTLLSDLPSELLILGGFYLYITGRLTRAGALWGMSTLVRGTNALIFASFTAGFLLTRPGGRNKADGLMRLIIGFAPFIGLTLINNYYSFGGMTTVPSNLLGRDSFSLAFVPRNLGFFLISLLAVYPLMLIGPLLYRGPARLEILLSIVSLIIFHSLYYYLQTWDRPLEWVILASRYLLPLVPFFLLCYPLVWKRLLDGIRLRSSRATIRLAAVTMVVMILASVGVQARHYEFQAQLARYRDLIYQNVPANAVVFGTIDAVKLLNPGWGFRDRRLLLYFDDCLPVDNFIDEAFSQSRPVYVVDLTRSFRDPNNVIGPCVAGVVSSHRGERAYHEEAPWTFSIYRLRSAEDDGRNPNR